MPTVVEPHEGPCWILETHPTVIPVVPLAGMPRTAATDSANFSQPLNKVASVYLSLTILSTVGFGDIVSPSDTSRLSWDGWSSTRH